MFVLNLVQLDTYAFYKSHLNIFVLLPGNYSNLANLAVRYYWTHFSYITKNAFRVIT